MVLVWVLNATVAVLTWLLDRFSFLPSLSWPAPLSVTVPVPLLGAHGAALQGWFGLAVTVSAGLLVGRVLMWLYKLIPFNG